MFEFKGTLKKPRKQTLDFNQKNIILTSLNIQSSNM
jgi:hypothetical protein